MARTTARIVLFALFGIALLGAPALAQIPSTDAVSVGAGIRYICQNSAPTPTGRARLWVRCSDGLLIYTTTANVDFSYLPIAASNIGFSAITSGTGNAHEYLDVSLGKSFAAATGATGYSVEVQISLTNSTDPGIVWWVVNKTTIGFRINFSGDFNGEVRWRAF